MDFLKRRPPTQILLIVVVAVAAFLRLWNFPNTMQFLGDQGRDAIAATHIFRDHHPVLIGPVTSTGNMYLGPLYYYFMAPFLMITYPSPVGPAYAIAFFSILAVYLLYDLGRELVGEKAAMIGTVFFALSSVAITFSRFSWNPNLAPFVSILLLWSTYRALTKSPWYFALCSLWIAILMQLHYVTLLTVPITGIFWLVALWNIWRNLKNKKTAKSAMKQLQQFILATVLAIVIFVAFLSPLIIFDLRHNFLNLRSLQAFLTEDDGGFNHSGSLFKLLNVVNETHGRSLLVLCEMFIGKFRALNSLIVFICIGVFAWLLSAQENKHKLGHTILATYILVSVIGLSFYQSSVFFHYVAFLYPVTMLIYGVILAKFSEFKIGKIAGAIFFAGFVIWNFQNLPFRSLSWNVGDIHRATQTIADRVKPGEKYNIVLLTGTGDIEGQNYRYFLNTTANPPLPKEKWGDTQTLFIINEDKKLKRVVDSPIYEIVVFPNKNPTEVYTIPNGPEITVLRK